MTSLTPPVNVLGLDPSLTGTGLAGPTGTLATVKTAPAGDTLPERAARLAGIRTRVLDAARGCDLAVIEGPSFGQGGQSGRHERSGLWWLLVDDLIAAGVPVLEVPPSSLKRYAAGKGNATKADMRMALYVRAELDVRDDNQVDAWWLRALGRHLLGSPVVTVPAAHLTGLAKLRLPAVLA